MLASMQQRNQKVPPQNPIELAMLIELPHGTIEVLALRIHFEASDQDGGTNKFNNLQHAEANERLTEEAEEE